MATRRVTYRIEVKDDGQWVDAPGEASGWTKAEAAAIARAPARIPTMDGSPSDWEGVRIVREEKNT